MVAASLVPADMQRQRSRRRQALQTPPAYAQDGIYTEYTYNTHGHLGYCPGHTRTTGCVCAPLPVRGHRIPAQAGLQFVDAEYAAASFSIRNKHVESCLAAGHHGWHPYTPTWRTDIRCLDSRKRCGPCTSTCTLLHALYNVPAGKQLSMPCPSTAYCTG